MLRLLARWRIANWFNGTTHTHSFIRSSVQFIFPCAWNFGWSVFVRTSLSPHRPYEWWLCALCDVEKVYFWCREFPFWRPNALTHTQSPCTHPVQPLGISSTTSRCSVCCSRPYSYYIVCPGVCRCAWEFASVRFVCTTMISIFMHCVSVIIIIFLSAKNDKWDLRHFRSQLTAISCLRRTNEAISQWPIQGFSIVLRELSRHTACVVIVYILQRRNLHDYRMKFYTSILALLADKIIKLQEKLIRAARPSFSRR